MRPPPAPEPWVPERLRHLVLAAAGWSSGDPPLEPNPPLHLAQPQPKTGLPLSGDDEDEEMGGVSDPESIDSFSLFGSPTPVGSSAFSLFGPPARARPPRPPPTRPQRPARTRPPANTRARSKRQRPANPDDPGFAKRSPPFSPFGGATPTSDCKNAGSRPTPFPDLGSVFSPIYLGSRSSFLNEGGAHFPALSPSSNEPTPGSGLLGDPTPLPSSFPVAMSISTSSNAPPTPRGTFKRQRESAFSFETQRKKSRHLRSPSPPQAAPQPDHHVLQIEPFSQTGAGPTRETSTNREQDWALPLPRVDKFPGDVDNLVFTERAFNVIPGFDWFWGRGEWEFGPPQGSVQNRAKFFSGEPWRTRLKGHALKINLPRLHVPDRLPPHLEAKLAQFRAELARRGYQRIVDRATLAIFAFGEQHPVDFPNATADRLEKFLEVVLEIDQMPRTPKLAKQLLHLNRNFDGYVRQDSGDLWCFHRMEWLPFDEEAKCDSAWVLLFHRMHQFLFAVTFEDLCTDLPGTKADSNTAVTVCCNPTGHSNSFPAMLADRTLQNSLFKAKHVFNLIWPMDTSVLMLVDRRQHWLFEGILIVRDVVQTVKKWFTWAGYGEKLGENIRILTLHNKSEFVENLPPNFKLPAHLGGKMHVFRRLAHTEMFRRKIILPPDTETRMPDVRISSMFGRGQPPPSPFIR